jgi:hypothetical protein
MKSGMGDTRDVHPCWTVQKKPTLVRSCIFSTICMAGAASLARCTASASDDGSRLSPSGHSSE